MNASQVPPPLAAFPLVSDWLSFGEDGTVSLLSGRVELGQGIATALIQIAADELDVPMAAVRLTQGHSGMSPAEGPTVGSLSVSFGGQSIRMASAAARALMLSHAAGLLQSDAGDLTVQAGEILRDGVETGLSYTRLAADVNLEVPALDHAAPKPASERQVAGNSVPRVDLMARLGGGYFLHDLALEGMWHGRVIQPPASGARLTDPPDGSLSGDAVWVRDGSFLAVVAPEEYVALSEANRVAETVKWALPEPGKVHPADALDGEIVQSETLYDFEQAPTKGREVRATVTRQVLSHGSIGPSCAVAHWDGDKLTVWAHSQNVFALKAALAEIFDQPQANITVIFTPGAGCYGHNSSDDVALDAALMARNTGRPVRALWQRLDEFQHAPLGPAMRSSMTAWLGDDNRIAAYQAEVISPPHSTRSIGAKAPNLRAQQFLAQPRALSAGMDAPQPLGGGADRNSVPGYAIPQVRVVRARPPIVPYRASALRGLGAFANVIALEGLMESCAEAAGEDSVAFRLAHLDDPRAREVIQTACKLAGDRKPAEGVGFGLGYSRYKNSAGYMACVARVEVADEVRVTDVWSAADVGEAINPDGTLNQIEGGIVQAVSWALKEEVAFSGGQNLTRDWGDYPILRFSEIPRMDTRLIGPRNAPPLGAGEISAGPAGAAIVNAVRDALGVVPDRLPLTRHALLALAG